MTRTIGRPRLRESWYAKAMTTSPTSTILVMKSGIDSTTCW